MLLTRLWRRFWVVARILPPFLAIFFTRDGIFGRDGRILIWGKARRSFLSLFPAWSRALQKKHGVSGGCQSCGASCNLLFQCPHWDPTTRLCTVYEDRPNICRLFPVTPADIRDRDIVLRKQPCGFSFPERIPAPPPIENDARRLVPALTSSQPGPLKPKS